jgi:hypothetical protein
MPNSLFKVLKAQIQEELSSLDDVHAALTRRVGWLSEPRTSDPYLVEDIFAALAMTLHDLYTGSERILLRIINHIDGGIPKTEEWHREALRRATLPVPGVRGPILSDSSICDFLSELRGLRHVIRNVYVHRLKRENLLNLGKQAVEFYPRFRSEIKRFIASLESENLGRTS